MIYVNREPVKRRKHTRKTGLLEMKKKLKAFDLLVFKISLTQLVMRVLTLSNKWMEKVLTYSFYSIDYYEINFDILNYFVLLF